MSVPICLDQPALGGLRSEGRASPSSQFILPVRSQSGCGSLALGLLLLPLLTLCIAHVDLSVLLCVTDCDTAGAWAKGVAAQEALPASALCNQHPAAGRCRRPHARPRAAPLCLISQRTAPRALMPMVPNQQPWLPPLCPDSPLGEPVAPEPAGTVLAELSRSSRGEVLAHSGTRDWSLAQA